ncbi:dTDP-4-amino-4,6-dideoxygalactose transaminase [bacterium]|nr:dTDP-4-amino-4,6-dideoxygalactose transaminase [bacterium]
MIPFNKPALIGTELELIADAVKRGKISGNGYYTGLCQRFFEERYDFGKCLLTTSCTDALEMAAILLDIGPGDEVILPAYTFVSSANAFVLRGAALKFADSCTDHPNVDVESIAQLISPRTKAIVVVHYAGMACDMDAVCALATSQGVAVVEDAAQAIDACYGDQPLGGIGDLGTFSFHETKNINCGEGGMLVVNNPDLRKRAEIIWEKGTNRAAFWRGEVDKYGWVDIGSSFLPSELNAAFLYAQLLHLNTVIDRRVQIWEYYSRTLSVLEQDELVTLPRVPEKSTNNGHIFYVLTRNENERDALLQHLNKAGVHAVFHYQVLHLSRYFRGNHDGRVLLNAERYEQTLVRLPLYYPLSDIEVETIVASVKSFYA